MNVKKQHKQAAGLYASTLAGVALGMLSSIVNTRFMSTSDYGDVRYVQNMIFFVASFLLFGYFQSGARLLAFAQNSMRSRRIKGVMVVILLMACMVLCVAMLVCWWLHSDDPAIAWLFVVSVPVCAYPLLQNYVEQTTIGDNQIGRLAVTRILPYLIYVPLAFFVYKYTGANSSKMILLQWGVYSVVYVGVIISTRPVVQKLGPVWRDIKDENRKYGIQLYMGSIVMVATNYLAGISLGYFNDENSEVGFYTLALTVTAPLAYLPTVVGNTYFKQFASQPCIPKKVIVSTVLLTIASCLCFILLIHHIVILLYTERYAVVGTYASYLAVGYCMHGLGDMFNRFLCSHGRGKEVKNASVLNGLMKVAGYTILVALWNTNGAVVTMISCDMAYFFCLLHYYRKVIKGAV